MLLNNINLSIAKKLHYINKNSFDHCKIETPCISFPAIYGLTAIDNILIAGRIRAGCPCDQIGDVATTCFTENAEVAQRKMPYFRFLRTRSNVSAFVL